MIKVMKSLGLQIIALLIFISCNPPSNSNIVEISTRFGDIKVEVYPDKAPLTAGRFLKYVDSGFYKNGTFYRVLSRDNQPTGAFAAELIQGGIYSKKDMDYMQGIPHEPTSKTGIKHEHGTISMARNEPGTATTEFFICIGNNPGFDEGGNNSGDGLGYAAFGRVIAGMEIVNRIYNLPEKKQSFTPPIGIINIHRQ